MKRLAFAVSLALMISASPATAQDATPPPEDEWQTDGFDEWGDWKEEDASPLTIAGFVEVAAGRRLQNDPTLSSDTTLADVRVQLQADYALETSQISFRGDVWYDGVTDDVETSVRELAWQGGLAMLGDWGSHFDAKIGQQVLTWGTGDYVFLNDMFPKDYQSFFAGRDDEYLKAPSLSAKLSGYFDAVNFDVVVTPEFEPDNGIDGEFFSFFSPQDAMNIAPEFTIAEENEPDGSEVALRLYKTVDTTEYALYGYRGYNKLPQAADELGRPMYRRLNVYGFSAVRPLGPGLGKFEYAYHDAVDDSHGDNPRIPNSQSRFLVGYEQELVANLTGSAQWYVEQTHDHDALLANSPWPELEQEETRHVITTQLVYRAMRQTLTLQDFNFYSPTDEDGYLRVKATYSPGDKWQASAGVNGFYGSENHTFYSQFRDASNVYVSFRWFYQE